MEKSCGTIVIDNDKVLLVKQNKGHYGFPKGHMENDEKEVETAIRETKEETNIDVVIDDVNKKYKVNYIMNNNIEKEVIFFLARPITFELKRDEKEISDAFWVSIDKVYDILSYDNIKEIWLEIYKKVNK